MASRYDELDASKELEQEIAEDLRAALAPRGCVVTHNGTETTPAPGGKADITITDSANSRLILVEVTRRKGAAADGEFAAITAHLDAAVAAGGYKDYCCLYVSPATSARMALNIIDRHNRLRQTEKKKGRIIALDFATVEEAIDRWRTSDPQLYPAARLGALFARWADAPDDARARALVARVLFEEDAAFVASAEERLREHDTANEQALRRAMEKLENQLRDRGVTGPHANETLIYLTFMRLYEEKRQRDHGEDNRFTAEGFRRWADSLPKQIQTSKRNRLVQYLLEEIAEDPSLKQAGLLRVDGETDQIHRAVTDEFVIARVLEEVFDRYSFYSSEIDVLGVVFETLARRGEKDTRVGQFFTPQEVVNFCALLVRLRSVDKVLDPAVGTGRFLIAAMVRMLAVAKTSTERRNIRSHQLFGTDIDNWIVTIAKMNMFIHGDGKTTIALSNGLALGDRGVFGNLLKNGVADQVDVVLTNPPLGDTSYTVARDMWAGGRDVTDEEVEAFFDSLGVVPMREEKSPAQRQFESAQTRLSRWEEKLKAALSSGDEKVIARVEKWRDKAVDDLATKSALVAGGPPPVRVATGERMKGGALFLGAIASYLRTDRSPGEGIEWQGGRCAIVVDEAILNTPEYGHVRKFVRDNYYVKAVISLGRPAFKYLAHTDAKTSILYLIKKPDPNLSQKEPVFFAHAERVGYSSVGKWIGSDLPGIGLRYSAFEETVIESYRGRHFDAATCAVRVAALAGAGVRWHSRFLPDDETARLDFFDARYHDLVKRLEAEGVELTTIGALMKPREPAHPPASTDDVYEFATIDRNLGTIQSKGKVATTYKPGDLWRLQQGDLVVSGIDLVHGAVAVAGRDVAGLVMSKEMFPYEPTDQVLPEYLAMLLRAEVARTLIHGRVTGTSNRTRVTSPAQILDIPIPKPPSKREQEVIVRNILNARTKRSEAERQLADSGATVARLWRLSVEGTPDSIDEEPETDSAGG